MSQKSLLAGVASEDTLASILAKIIATPATAAGQATGNASLAEIVTALAGVLTTRAAGSDMVQTTITLTAQQAAGTAPLLDADPARRVLQFRADADFEISLVAGAAQGQRIYASARDELQGALCPRGALYLVPNIFVADTVIVVWTA